jgi:alkylation response protein AidB-like acyl-CoA dehydrogenase
MPFFIQDQKSALDRLHRNDPQHEDVLAFLQGPVDRFLTERVAPGAAANDVDERFDTDLFRALGETGYFGLPLGEDVGGLGAGFTYLVAALESLAKADAGFALGVAIHGTCTDGIYRFGNDEQIQRFVPALASGSKIGCFGLTEHDSGSDANPRQDRIPTDPEPDRRTGPR